MSAKADDKSSGLLARPRIGFAARVVQHSELRFSRIVIDRPVLIVLRHGTKSLRSARGQWSVRGGEAIAIAGGQTFDVTNRLSDKGVYEARWLVWDETIIERFEQSAGNARALTGAVALGKIDPHFSSAFDRALEAISEQQRIPDDIAEHRLAEVLIWLSLRRVHFPAAENSSIALKVRRLFETSLTERWTAASVARHLAMSEATLRRRLAAEGTTLGYLLSDVRMSFAMLLLQSTEQAVNHIAREVGYESPSRFAIRFRERFGFPPTAIRGHARNYPGQERSDRDQ
ncbi:helix-turn-helix transcriptional regulator [Dongia sp.]|uniref:helix-turn-helix transcriptional regulator n=1 Tax=Dongia sp. TaxID=1977262 RepID=UPI0035B3047B